MKGYKLDDGGLLFCRLTFFVNIPIDGNWRSLDRTNGDVEYITNHILQA